MLFLHLNLILRPNMNFFLASMSHTITYVSLVVRVTLIYVIIHHISWVIDPHCIFLGYPFNYKGNRYFDHSNNDVYISRHVIFNEDSFPYPHLLSLSSPKSSLTSLNFELPSVIDIYPYPVQYFKATDASSISTTTHNSMH